MRILLISFDTQKEQLKNMLDNPDIEVLELNNNKGKIKKLIEVIRKIIKSDIVYIGYGCYKRNIYLYLAKIFNKRTVSHWIGTDVLLAKENKNLNKVLKYIDCNLTCSPVLKEELKEIGIDAIEMPIVPNWNDTNYSKLPIKHSVLIYMPEKKEGFYGLEYVKCAAEAYPELKFYIVANDNDILNLKNVKFLGRLSHEEMEKLYDKITILLRMPKHDGLSLMLLEALIKGKEVIYSYKFPYTQYATSKEEVNNKISKIIQKQPEFNKLGHQYVLKNYDINNIKENLKKILFDVCAEKGKI